MSYLWLFFVFLLLGLVWASADVRSSLYLRMYRRGDRDVGNRVCLTFDDGPDALGTPVVLDALNELGIQGCFFLIGRNIPGNEKLVKRMVEEGHIVGLHGWEHRWYTPFLPKGVLADNLRREQELVKSVAGCTPLLFRPPFGVTSPTIAGAVRRLGLTPVAWSIRSLDTQMHVSGAASVDEWLNGHVISRLHPGAVVLLHDRMMGIDGLLRNLAMGVREAGYQFGGIEEVLGIKAYGRV